VALALWQRQVGDVNRFRSEQNFDDRFRSTSLMQALAFEDELGLAARVKLLFRAVPG